MAERASLRPCAASLVVAGLALLPTAASAARVARQGGLIVLHRQYIIAAALHDGRRHRTMAMQRIGRHDAALQLQEADQLQGGRCFVVARRQRAGQRHTGLNTPRGHHDRGHVAPAALVGPPQRLAIERNHPLDPCRRRKRLGEPPKRRLERLRIEQAKHAAERIVARQAMIERQDVAQHWLLGTSEFRHVAAVLRSAQRCQKRDEQELGEIVLKVACARIGQIAKHSANRSIGVPRIRRHLQNPHFLFRQEAA
jgi:hypothetical protein